MKKKSKAKKVVLALAAGLVLWTGAKMAGQNHDDTDEMDRIVAQQYESEPKDEEPDTAQKKPTMPERPDAASKEDSNSDSIEAAESDIDDIAKTNTDETRDEPTSRENHRSELLSSPDGPSDRESGSHSGIRPEFQRAMDEYEKYFQDYADFIPELFTNLFLIKKTLTIFR